MERPIRPIRRFPHGQTSPDFGTPRSLYIPKKLFLISSRLSANFVQDQAPTYLLRATKLTPLTDLSATMTKFDIADVDRPTIGFYPSSSVAHYRVHWWWVHVESSLSCHKRRIFFWRHCLVLYDTALSLDLVGVQVPWYYTILDLLSVRVGWTAIRRVSVCEGDHMHLMVLSHSPRLYL